jgi:hypothetical protein
MLVDDVNKKCKLYLTHQTALYEEARITLAHVGVMNQMQRHVAVAYGQDIQGD